MTDLIHQAGQAVVPAEQSKLSQSCTRAQRRIAADAKSITTKIAEMARGEKKRSSRSLQTAEVEEEILDRLSVGESLLSICQSEHLPALITVQRWRSNDADFSARVDAAYRSCTEVLADAVLDIASGGPLSMDNHHEDKVLIDAIKWYAAKTNPRKFGDRVDVNVDATRYTVIANPSVVAMMSSLPIVEATYTENPSETDE